MSLVGNRAPLDVKGELPVCVGCTDMCMHMQVLATEPLRATEPFTVHPA